MSVNEKRAPFTALACDVGGTNTTFALISGRPHEFRIVARHRCATQKLTSFDEGLSEAMSSMLPYSADYPVTRACVSAAGPVHGDSVQLTNASWDLHAGDIRNRIGAPVNLINDLEAVCYAVPLLDSDDPEQCEKLYHPDGNDPTPRGSVRAVVAAGTGLGVGFLSGDGFDLRVFPSEGGHADLAELDEETKRFRDHLRVTRGNDAIEAELFVSGQGIANAASFVEAEGGFSSGRIAESMRSASSDEKPAIVARHAADDTDCRRAMRLFIRMYGKFAAGAALTFLPYAGLYLGGGIAAKNLQHFAGDDTFMHAFRTHYNESMQKPLARIPVRVIRDYDVSLFGCAHCAYIQAGVPA